MKAKKVEKAKIECLDQSKWDIEFELNPSDLTITRDGGAKTTDANGPYGGDFEPEKLGYDKLTFSALFDETFPDELELSDVENWEAAFLVLLGQSLSLNLGTEEHKLLERLKALYRLSLHVLDKDAEDYVAKQSGTSDEKDAMRMELGRPPVCRFSWKDFKFVGVIDNIGVDFQLFDHDGNPKRAKVDVTMAGRAFADDVTEAKHFLLGVYVPTKLTKSLSAKTRRVLKLDTGSGLWKA